MVEQTSRPTIDFSGTSLEKELAEKIFGIMLARGMFMSANAPIRVPMTVLETFFADQGVTDGRDALIAAIAANPSVFVVESVDGQDFVVSTKEGRVPARTSPVSKHTFSARFLTPMPRPERPSAPRSRPRPLDAVVDVLAELDVLPPEEPIAEVVEVISEPEVLEEEAPAVVARTITTQVAKSTDVTDVDDINLAAALHERLGADPRVANFGEQWLMEDRVPRFSRGDL